MERHKELWIWVILGFVTAGLTIGGLLSDNPNGVIEGLSALATAGCVYRIHYLIQNQ